MAEPAFDLQPMSVGDLLDRAVRMYRRHLVHTLGIVILPYLAFVPAFSWLFLTIGERGSSSAERELSAIAAITLLFLGAVCFYLASMGALACSVSERYLGGRPTIRTVYGFVLQRSLALVWACLLTLAVAGGVFGVGFGLWAVGFNASRMYPTMWGYFFAAGLWILGIAVVVAGVCIFFRSLLITHVILIEDVRGWKALKRSWKLMRSSVWRAVLILVFGLVVGFIIGFLIEFPARIGFGWSPGRATVILRILSGQLGQILSVPFVGIAFTFLYYDTRIRREGFDLDMMAKNLGSSRESVVASMAISGVRRED